VTTKERLHSVVDELSEQEAAETLQYIASRREGANVDEPCALALDNIGPVVKGHMTKRITTLGPDKMAEVCRALSHATSC
jgi:mRNA-degrading endonuclease toxin of MazEF toxin-antitoxin module